MQLIGDGARSQQSVPLLGLAQAGSGGYFDDSGFPAGKGWDEVALPAAATSTPTRWKSPAIR